MGRPATFQIDNSMNELTNTKNISTCSNAKESSFGLQEAARNYLELGYSSIPVPIGKKAPVIPDWPNLAVTLKQIPLMFKAGRSNIGISLGDRSSGLVDIDLDCEEAVRCAPVFLPPTRTFGRESRPFSHYLFIAPNAETSKFQFDGGAIVELRSTGTQTIFPPSIHPSGEVVSFCNELDVVHIDVGDLERRVGMIAAASVVAKQLKQGIRHDAALALSGALLRAGYSEDEVKRFVRGVSVASADEELEDRIRAVESTAQRLDNGGIATGIPRLAEIIGQKAARVVLRWLGLSDAPDTPDTSLPDEPRQRPSQADQLLALTEGIDLFHTPEKVAYASVEVGNHSEIYEVGGEEMGLWLQKKYFDAYKRGVSNSAVEQVRTTLAAKGRFDGSERRVYTRVAGHEGKVYLDLGNDAWQVIEIGPDGWRVLNDSPVAFRRPGSMGSLPIPERGRGLGTLRRFVNAPDDDDFILIVAFLLMALHPEGPYPVLVLQGEQGSAKSSTAKMLKAIIDPSKAPLRNAPSNEQDLMISAENAQVLVYDNISRIPPNLSDTLCRLATGTGFATRVLYTNRGEATFEVARPVVLTGIGDLVERDDLASRSIVLDLPPIVNRRTEAELQADFERAHPQILGAALDAVSVALRDWATTKPTTEARMLDFVRWVTAAESELPWSAGAFGEALTHNIEAAVLTGVDADPVARAIVDLMNASAPPMWEGTTAELLHDLERFAPEHVKRSKAWPKTPTALSSAIRRSQTSLRKAFGIEFEEWRTPDKERKRMKRISRR